MRPSMTPGTARRPVVGNTQDAIVRCIHPAEFGLERALSMRLIGMDRGQVELGGWAPVSGHRELEGSGSRWATTTAAHVCKSGSISC